MSMSMWSRWYWLIVSDVSGSNIWVPLWLDENTSGVRFTSLRWAWRVMAQ